MAEPSNLPRDVEAAAESTAEKSSTKLESNPSPRRKVLQGVLVVAGIAVTWAASTQFRKSSLASKESFSGPFFLVWFNTAWMLLSLPFYYLLAFLLSLVTAAPPPPILSALFKSVRGKQESIVPRWVLPIPFAFLWLGANYTYCSALAAISATEVTALFSSNILFVYLLSFLLLKEPFHPLKALGVVVGVSGIVLMALSVGWGESVKLGGMALAVFAAALAASYKVSYKRFVKLDSLAEVALFLSGIGCCSTLFGLPVVLGLSLSGVETVSLPTIPWSFLLASALFFFCFNFLVNFGISIAPPLTIAIGIFLGLPLNAVVDAVLRGEAMSELKVGGSVCILLAFLAVVLADSAGNNKEGILARLWEKLRDFWGKKEPPVPSIQPPTSYKVFVLPLNS